MKTLLNKSEHDLKLIWNNLVEPDKSRSASKPELKLISNIEDLKEG
jgi:hypothetical protein